MELVTSTKGVNCQWPYTSVKSSGTVKLCITVIYAYFQFQFVDCRQNPADCAITARHHHTPRDMRQQ